MGLYEGEVYHLHPEVPTHLKMTLLNQVTVVVQVALPGLSLTRVEVCQSRYKPAGSRNREQAFWEAAKLKDQRKLVALSTRALPLATWSFEQRTAKSHHEVVRRTVAQQG